MEINPIDDGDGILVPAEGKWCRSHDLERHFWREERVQVAGIAVIFGRGAEEFVAALGLADQAGLAFWLTKRGWRLLVYLHSDYPMGWDIRVGRFRRKEFRALNPRTSGRARGEVRGGRERLKAE